MQKAKPTAECAGIIQLGKGAGLDPVAKAEAIVDRVASEHDDEGKDDETHAEENLSEGGPEFALAIPLDGKEIDQSKEKMVSPSR